MLQKGEKALNFKVKDIEGNDINLSNFKGQPILITFFRGASCPFCNLRIHKLIANYEKFKELGLSLLCFFASDRETILKYTKKQAPPFPVLPDPEMDIYKQYRVESSYLGMVKSMGRVNEMVETMQKGYFNLDSMKEPPLIPADFLINANQEIVYAYYGKDFGDHIKLDLIFNFLKK